MSRFSRTLAIACAATIALIGANNPPSRAIGDSYIAAVGDIACPPGTAVTTTTCQQDAVGALIQNRQPDLLLAVGDEQYNSGALPAFQQSYDQALGWALPITRPVPGNHEYGTTGAAGYASYYGEAAPFWYSFDVGGWHVVALDSNCSKIGGCGLAKPQGQWLKADLAAHPAQCTLAFWHHPRFNSGEHSGATNMTWAWRLLYQAHADVVLNGHEHSYQRFALLKYDGTRDPNGIREFVSGAGGKSHYAGGSTSSLSEYRNTTDFGALFLTLHPTSYDWQWVTTSGQVKDSGSEPCR